MKIVILKSLNPHNGEAKEIALKDRGYCSLIPGIIFGRSFVDGWPITIQKHDVSFVQSITDDEFNRRVAENKRRREEAQQRAEEAAKANPRPGREPRLVVPR